MASATAKKPCVKCNKGGGVATCDGCQQSWCTKHFIEHRQELSQQMDKLGEEHDLLQRDLSQKSNTYPLLSDIDKWEQESITKIQVAAEVARFDLRQSIDLVKNELKASVTLTTSELQSSRESDDYTEVDLKRWFDQLNELRKRLERPSTIEIVHDDGTASSIRLIKVKDQSQPFASARSSTPSKRILRISPQSVELARERFDQVVGHVTLAENGLVATCSYPSLGSSATCGKNEYSFGIHHIRLFIEQKRSLLFFFGIESSLATKFSLSSSTYGWRDLDAPVENGRSKRGRFENTIETGDEITLALDCDNRQIQLQHQRTNRVVFLPIELHVCPFPWRIRVELQSVGDCVRILH